MASNRTPTRFYGPAGLSSTPGTLYTVPANKIAVVKSVILYPTGADFVWMGIGGTDSDDQFLNKGLLADSGTQTIWMYVVLTEGETIQGANSDDSSVASIYGDLYDE